MVEYREGHNDAREARAERQGTGRFDQGPDPQRSKCFLHQVGEENEEDEAGDDFEDEDEEGGDVGEDDEDEEGSVVGEGQGEDGEDGREGKDDDQYAQAGPDPSGAANSLNFYDNNLFIFSQRARSARPPPVYSPHGSASAASSDVHRGVPSEDLFPLAEVVSLNYFMWQHAPRFIV